MKESYTIPGGTTSSSLDPLSTGPVHGTTELPGRKKKFKGLNTVFFTVKRFGPLIWETCVTFQLDSGTSTLNAKV